MCKPCCTPYRCERSVKAPVKPVRVVGLLQGRESKEQQGPIVIVALPYHIAHENAKKCRRPERRAFLNVIGV